MMWCYCYHHRVWKILREFTYEDDFNNTFLFKMSFSAIAGLESWQN